MAKKWVANYERLARLEDAIRAGFIDPAEPWKEPTRIEVVRFWLDQHLRGSPNQFFDYYDSRGWKTKTGKLIRNWYDSARAWSGRQKPESKP